MNEPNSLERMLGILAAFDEMHLERTPEELMRRLGYSRPTLYRYLKTLREAGLIVGVGQAAYTLGPKIVEMDFLLRRADPLVLEGRALLEELAGRHPGTAFLSRWYRDRVLCVTSISSSDEALSSYPRGRPMPVGRGSTSHAIMAFLPRRQAVALIDSSLDVYRGIGLGGRDAVLARFRAIRRDGYATARGEVTAGVVGTAAPVFDGGKAPIASLCLTMAEAHADAFGPERLGREVAATADRLSERLSARRILRTGGQPDPDRQRKQRAAAA
ncbi:MAG: Transcriptional regulator, IclR family protein [Rhizobiaceae bacterium]|jgi:DNA-binding IclR family transcriptional regulator|nr:Transcriptional regulator, IclR family protein [Rhizobiaceae bacterium]